MHPWQGPHLGSRGGEFWQQLPGGQRPSSLPSELTDSNFFTYGFLQEALRDNLPSQQVPHLMLFIP